ncbi:MAG TPA: hypothetical protein VJN43_02485 [Bryobacteraceae bacterium]|nr:hypothetical protein [Bryobacteraceae bacterium]
MRARFVLALISASWLFGQSAGTAPKDKPPDYPAHAAVGDIAIGADYLVHSIPANTQTFFAPDYLVVEVAVFPKRGSSIEIGVGTFTLRVNGKKQAIYSDSTGMVAASVKYPDWEQRKNLEVGAAVGDAGVVIGRPPAVGRFPDNPRQQQTRLPRLPKAPDAQQGVEREEPEDLDTALARTALPQGAVSIPVSGYLYFRYQGKTKSIKSVELLYQGPAGTATLKLL